MTQPLDCGSCKACCNLLTIDTLDPPKRAGEWCQHCTPTAAKGCGIYATRPTACRDYACLWLQSQERPDPRQRMEEALRPDRSKVMVHCCPPVAGAPLGWFLAFELAPSAVHRTPRMAAILAASIEQGFPVMVMDRTGKVLRSSDPTFRPDPQAVRASFTTLGEVTASRVDVEAS